MAVARGWACLLGPLLALALLQRAAASAAEAAIAEELAKTLHFARLEAESALRRNGIEPKVPQDVFKFPSPPDGRFQPVPTLPPATLEHFPEAPGAMRALEELYEGHAQDTFYVKVDGRNDPLAAHEEVAKNMDGGHVAATYGEILPATVVELLARAGARPGQKYYDLGSGTGKTVVLAWLLGLDSVGVELASTRWGTGCDAVRHAREAKLNGTGGELRLVRSSFLDVDFSDADIIFMDSVMFTDQMKSCLSRGLRRLKPGAILVSFGGMPGPGLKKVGTFNGATSWSERTTWTIQTVEEGAALLQEAAGPVQDITSQRRKLGFASTGTLACAVGDGHGVRPTEVAAEDTCAFHPSASETIGDL